MPFKGNYSPTHIHTNQHILSGSEKSDFRIDINVEDFFPSGDQQQVAPELPEGFIEHPQEGIIHRNAIVYDTGCPIPGLANLGHGFACDEDLTDCNDYQFKRKNIVSQLSDCGLIEVLASIVNNFFCKKVKLTGGTYNKLLPSNIVTAQVCKHNHAIWYLEFDSDFWTEELVRIIDEGDGTSGGSEDESGGTSGDSKEEGAGLVSLVAFNQLQGTLGSIKAVQGTTPIAVGVVDRGDFDQGSTHAKVIETIIKGAAGAESGLVVKACPIVPFHNCPATVFDVICALYNRCILNDVQVINLSQGWYAKNPHPVLKKALAATGKPVVCSAGNDGTNNDIRPHWPSNFSMELDNVIAVSCEGRNTGQNSVTLNAIGNWNDQVRGSSYAAAWMSRMVGLAYAISGDLDITLSDIRNIIDDHYTVSLNPPDHTVTRLTFEST